MEHSPLPALKTKEQNSSPYSPSIDTNLLDKAENACLSHLLLSQRENGGFGSVVGDIHLSEGISRPTIFATSLILLALSGIQEKNEAETIIRRGVDFLIKEKGPLWSWNYWERNSAEIRTKPYPDDLDDTCSALAVISLYRKELIDGNAFASIAKLLIQSEAAEGGPYNTWIIPNPSSVWKDIDPAVNATIAYFLSLHSITLPNVVSYIDTMLKNNTLDSKYYFNSLFVLYFIARDYKGTEQKRLVELILAKKESETGWGGILSSACAVSSLLRLGYPRERLHKEVRTLAECALQGGFTAEALYIEEAKGTTLYCGSRSLTAACVIEALECFKKVIPVEKSRESITYETHASNIDKKVFSKFNDLFKHDPTFVKQAESITEKIRKGSSGRSITLLPFMTLSALQEENDATRPPDKLLYELGVANLCGWIAYRIYDDVLDNEGNPDFIPLANICLRESAEVFKDSAPTPSSARYIKHILNKIDSANSWEREHTKISKDPSLYLFSLPDYKDHAVLADKSLGHAVSAYTVFISHKDCPQKEVRNLISFFSYYLRARQINDDAHDWLPDIQRGFWNSASVELVKRWHLRHPSPTSLPSLSRILPELQAIFLNESLPSIANTILRYTEKAKIHLDSIKAFKDKTRFAALLTPIEQSAQIALSEQLKIKDFLRAY